MRCRMMKDSMIQVICGPGKGKTASALGRGVSALIRGKNVIMVQFLKEIGRASCRERVCQYV